MIKKQLFLLLLVLSISCKTNTNKKQFLLSKRSPNETGVSFKNEVKDEVNQNIINYIYYYNGGGVAVGDINNDNLPDLYFVSNKGDNKLYLNQGDLKFKDISETAGIEGKADWQTGVTMVDVNNDGYLDIYVCAVSQLLGFEGHNELYINNKDNTFTESSKEYNLDYVGYSTQAYFFDYDKDDDLDVYIVNHAVHTKTSNGPALLRKKRTALTGDVLLKNTDSKFTNVSEEAKIYGGVNGYGLSAAIADFNNDGWDDIYVCNDFHEDDYYYLNNQDGTFTESLANSFSMISRFSMGSDAADINGDGLQDLITLDMLPKDERVVKESEGEDAMLNVQYILKRLGYQDQYARNMLQMNNKGEYFHEEALYNDISDTDWSWAPLFADFNNDGHQDLFVANGILRRPNDLDFRMYISSKFKDQSIHSKKKDWLLESLKQMPSGKYPDQIFKGNSTKFQNKNNEWMEDTPSLSNGAVYADLDNDGDLDLVTNNINEPAQIFENQTNQSKNFIKLNFNYKYGNNRGIGTKAIVFNKNKKQVKQLFNSRGFISSVDNVLHFGIDSLKTVDSIQVIWPNNKFTTLVNPTINWLTTLAYEESNAKDWKPTADKTELSFTKSKLFDFKHEEDPYNDFYNERLIPYKISTTGPAFAKADINNDGFEDFFIGNSSERKSGFYLNNGTSIKEKDYPAITRDSLYEDTCAVFIDVDNDNDLDLYVGSGLHTIRVKPVELDRIYINNNGDFKRAENTFKNPHNTSCIKPYDYDGDGDMDVFLGNRSNPNDFGAKVASYLLKNDGKGNFTPDTNFKLASKVTDAIWTDINNDKVKDLIVTTEWDTPKVYINNKGNLTLQEIPTLGSGLWQTVSRYDIDNDGDEDILFGNWGLNTKFKVNKEAPLTMYHSDFDNNGKNETVLAYNIDGKYYPIHSKDELASQMNVIKKRFVKYSDYALKSVEDVLTKEAVDKSTKYTISQLASGYLVNDNGNFNTFKKFPKLFQLAPINTFKSTTINGAPHLLVFGNNKSVNTYHGGYESNKGLLVKDVNNYRQLSDLGVTPIDGQVKKSEVIQLKDKKLLLILQNNDSIQQYITK